MVTINNIMICDIHVKKQGHYIGFYDYILNNVESIEKENQNIKLSFLFNTEAQSLLSPNLYLSERIEYLELKTTGGLYNKYEVISKIRNHTINKKIDKLIFMEFDTYQISFSLMRFPYKITGILYRPHHRVTVSNTTLNKKLSNSFISLRKRIAEKILIQNKSIQTIFIYNDKEGVDLLNYRHKTNQFKYLPDPIFNYDTKLGSSTRIATGDQSPFRYLIFGLLDERKNITNILRAYDIATFNHKTEMLLVGPVSDDYLAYIKDLITKLKSVDNVEKRVTIYPNFVSNEEMDNYFSICDVCLIIYKDFFGSSGLIGRAALHKKKIVGSDTGVVCKVIEEYNLGLTCNPYNIGDIAKSLKLIQNTSINNSSFLKYYKKHSPKEFLSTLVSC